MDPTKHMGLKDTNTTLFNRHWFEIEPKNLNLLLNLMTLICMLPLLFIFNVVYLFLFFISILKGI